jgi:hypothetical protein
MAYPSAWERLSDAATRVMTAAGLSKDEAQSDICQAIADGAVKIRGKLGRHTTRHSRASETVLEGKDFDVPTTIKSEDLDWEKSRPVKPWMVRRGIFALAGYWDLDWIELSRTDVTNVLCPARKQNESAKLALSETGATSRSRPALESQETPAGSGPRSTAGPRKSGAARPARHRGPRPKKFEQARDAMRNDLQKGRLTAAGLETMLEKTLAADYGVSRDTARKARKAVLSELGEN